MVLFGKKSLIRQLLAPELIIKQAPPKKQKPVVHRAYQTHKARKMKLCLNNQLTI